MSETHWTQEKINQLARDLGAGPLEMSEIWNFDYNEPDCTLPAPDSTEPSAALWVGLLLAALHKSTCHTSIELNDHKSVYATLQEHLESWDAEDEDIVSPPPTEERLVTVQNYPDTPIGFTVFHSSALTPPLLAAWEARK